MNNYENIRKFDPKEMAEALTNAMEIPLLMFEKQHNISVKFDKEQMKNMLLFWLMAESEV